MSLEVYNFIFQPCWYPSYWVAFGVEKYKLYWPSGGHNLAVKYWTKSLTNLLLKGGVVFGSFSECFKLDCLWRTSFSNMSLVSTRARLTTSSFALLVKGGVVVCWFSVCCLVISGDIWWCLTAIWLSSSGNGGESSSRLSSSQGYTVGSKPGYRPGSKPGYFYCW